MPKVIPFLSIFGTFHLTITFLGVKIAPDNDCSFLFLILKGSPMNYFAEINANKICFRSRRRFWSRVSPSPIDDPEGKQCWVWVGSRHLRGSPRFHTLGKVINAQRIAYAIENGILPEGYKIGSICNNPACCNPKHLVSFERVAPISFLTRKKEYVPPATYGNYTFPSIYGPPPAQTTRRSRPWRLGDPPPPGADTELDAKLHADDLDAY